MVQESGHEDRRLEEAAEARRGKYVLQSAEMYQKRHNKGIAVRLHTSMQGTSTTCAVTCAQFRHRRGYAASYGGRDGHGKRVVASDRGQLHPRLARSPQPTTRQQPPAHPLSRSALAG